MFFVNNCDHSNMNGGVGELCMWGSKFLKGNK